MNASLSISAADAPAADRACDWQTALRQAYRTLPQLQAAGLVEAELSDAAKQRFAAYRLSIPRAYAEQFDRSNLRACPLYRQAVPWSGEDDPYAIPAWAQAASEKLYGRSRPWSADAIGDVARLGAPRLTHRYRHRALLHVTPACALYCRYCFRKEHLKDRHSDLYGGALAPAWAYLREHAEIHELVLSGGDPLTLPDAWWQAFLQQAAQLPHLQVLRIHTRMPAVLPERLTPALLQLLGSAKQQVSLVCHVNHPRELSEAVCAQLLAARRAGVTLLQQAVLLRGINDDVEVLAALWQKLYACGAIPFYLHHADWTPGTWGFRTSIDAGRALMQALAGRVSGPALPRYVLDMPEGHGKVDLCGVQVRCVRRHAAENGIAGAIWSMARSHTRTGGGAQVQRQQYLDMYPTAAAHA